MRIQILTLFPEMVRQGLSAGIIGRAAEQGLLAIEAHDIRDYTADRHRKVDDYPYGGGAGMLMQAQPVYDAWRAAREKASGPVRTVYLTPQGSVFTQEHARELAREEELILLCGHYEGIDERVLEEIVTDYLSIGDYVLTGGELAAMVVTDAVARMVPGVLGNELSGETESFEGELLEHPQYSRPRVWMGKAVPEVLLSGDQRRIDAWRRRESVGRTRQRRPDLYAAYLRLEECRERLLRQKLLHIDMIELIARGKARLLYAEGDDICLLDKESGILFHTAENEASGCRMLEDVFQAIGDRGRELPELLVLHQEELVEPVCRAYGYGHMMTCGQAVYTRREKLPVRGRCSPDAKKPVIRRLMPQELSGVAAHYEKMGNVGVDAAYLKERTEKGWMYGAFLDGQLAGFAGMHTEGSLGLLTVLPEYRGRGIGKALETAMINRMLDRGFTPYGQVEEENESSRRLQESLGLCFSKSPVFWLQRRE